MERTPSPAKRKRRMGGVDGMGGAGRGGGGMRGGNGPGKRAAGTITGNVASGYIGEYSEYRDKLYFRR